MAILCFSGAGGCEPSWKSEKANEMGQPPKWLNRLAQRVCECIELPEGAPPVGCHHHFNGEHWEITLFIMSTEIVGGPHDGVKVSTRFFLDLSRLRVVLDSVESSEWQPHRIDETDDLGPHVALTGVFQGRRVWLRVLADSPDRFHPGRLANLLTRSFDETGTP
jgi:hypothetical protein